MQKGYNIESVALNEKIANNLNEFGFDLRFKKPINFLKDSIRHRNMKGSIKVKDKK